MKIQMSSNKKEKPKDINKVDWGTVFTDYVFEMSYKNGKWQESVIKPYGSIMIEPACTTLHYAQSVFEGQKIYKSKNSINLFRPNENLNRLNKSCERMCIPTFSEEKKKEIMIGLKTLVQMDKDWISEEPNSLYVRVFVFGDENFIGIRPSNTYKMMIILSPISAYLGGFKDIKLMIPTDYIRAVKGGSGMAKTSGNYAQTLLPVKDAKMRGYDQCLFLNTNGLITEASAANIFFIINNKVITPKLSGEILDGITRKSLIEIAKDKGYDVREEFMSIDHLLYDYEMGRIDEIFICGTAAAIVPVSELYYKENTLKPNQPIGKITTELYTELLNIQYGRIEDKHNWIVKIN